MAISWQTLSYGGLAESAIQERGPPLPYRVGILRRYIVKQPDDGHRGGAAALIAEEASPAPGTALMDSQRCESSTCVFTVPRGSALMSFAVARYGRTWAGSPYSNAASSVANR